MCSFPCSQTLSKPKGDASNAQTAHGCVCVYVGVCVCVCLAEAVAVLGKGKCCCATFLHYDIICLLINIDGAICFMFHARFNIEINIVT